MKANEIFVKTRLYLEDIAKARYSDWEVFSGINDALRLVAEENAKVGGPLFRKRINLSLAPDTMSAILPDDFVREIKAFDADGAELLNVHNDEPFGGEFSVKGASVFAADDFVTLWYFSYPPTVKTPNDEIDIPVSMAIPIAKIASACVQNHDDAAVEKTRFFYARETPIGQHGG